MSMESSAAVYDALTKKVSPKGVKSLKHVKAACDMIVAAQGIMNYSSVARMATERHGGPKMQSIQNSKDLKRYIDARNDEYTQAKRTHRVPDVAQKGEITNKYPVDNLDSRTKTYIDQLRSRLRVQEAHAREIRKRLLKESRIQPLSLSEAIENGPSKAGALKLASKADNSESRELIRQAIDNLLSLSSDISSLEMEEKGEKRRLTLCRPAGNRVILTPSQLTAIEQLMKELKDGK